MSILGEIDNDFANICQFFELNCNDYSQLFRIGNGQGRPRVNASYDDLIVALFQQIGLSERQTSYLTDPSKDNVTFEEL